MVTPFCTILDIIPEMKCWIQEHSVARVTVPAKVLADEALDIFLRKYEDTAVKALTIPQIVSLIYRSRSSEFFDWESLISSHPLVHCHDSDERLFLQFNTSVNIDGCSLQKLIGWAHPDILFQLKAHRWNLFIDCTFHVPKGFEQCLIIMVYLPAYDEYVPLCWVLLQGKSRNTYQTALMNVIAMCDWRLNASSFCTDFELPLFQAAKSNFPEATPILCLFHWKQAIRRKLISLKLDDSLIRQLITDGGLLEILTYIPTQDIATKGKYIFLLFQITIHFYSLIIPYSQGYHSFVTALLPLLWTPVLLKPWNFFGLTSIPLGWNAFPLHFGTFPVSTAPKTPTKSWSIVRTTPSNASTEE